MRRARAAAAEVEGKRERSKKEFERAVPELKMGSRRRGGSLFWASVAFWCFTALHP